MIFMKIFKSNALSGILSKLCLLILLVAPAPAYGQGWMLIGHCNGEVATTSSIGVNNATDGIEVAALFSASMLEKYDDLQVLGINVGLANRLNVSKITAWVRETLEGDNLFEASLTKEEGIIKGWNKIMGVAAPLPEGKDYYVGYTLELKGASYPVSAVGEGREGKFLMKKGGQWIDMSEQGYGVLSIELVATASNLVPYDLMLKQASIPETIKIGSTVPLLLKVFNAGVETVKGFKVECSIENCYPILYDLEANICPNEYADIEVDFTPPFTVKMNDVSMNVAIKEIQGGEDSDISNNTVNVVFSVNRFDFAKRLLIEEFSTEKCTYCPQAAANLHRLLDEPEFENKISAIVHHVGFNTDWLTIPASNNYLWFYDGGAGNVYAPAFMFDRYGFDNSTPVSGGTDDYSSIKQRAEERLATAPKTALEATVEYDNENAMLNIHVEGERLSDYEGDRLTICIVENNIKARKQAGTTETFIHQHVIRDINEIWGYEIDWTSDSFTYDTSIHFNPSWIMENVEIIAFISKYDSTNYKNCAVDNVVTATISGGAAGEAEFVREIANGDAEYYTLSGLRVMTPATGLYLVKRGNKVTKEYVK